MPSKRALVKLLDRPGGRFLLGRIATYGVRRAGAKRVRISYHEGLWTRCIGSDFFPDGERFEYEYADFNVWDDQMHRYAADTREFWLHWYQPQAGEVVVDVGAGRGEDVVTFSRAVGPAGRVIAIEAHPRSFVLLKSFCRMNGLTNVTAIHLAAMDRSGAVRVSDSGSSWMEAVAEWGNGSSGAVVPASTVDEVCRAHGIGEIAYLKMNIEGAERYALAGMQQTLPKIRRICVACHDFRADLGHGEQFRTRALVEEKLRGCGFQLMHRADDSRDFVRDHVFGMRRA